MLFFTEMWERFSYYGMRGLLKLYMVNYLFVVSRQILQGGQDHGIGDPHAVLGWDFFRHLIDSNPDTPPGAYASVIYGWYTGFVYLTPLLGGFLADRYWGQRKTVFFGGALMAAGHFLMAFENWFFFALLLLIIGNGAFKPNISTQVGNLYPPGDPRRDGAFTIFYMGINLGAFICNLVCGTLAATLGWHWGFGAAGVGMVLGLTVYFFGQRYLAADNVTATKAIPQAERKQALDASEKRRVLGLDLSLSFERRVLGSLRAARQYDANLGGREYRLAGNHGFPDSLDLVSIVQSPVHIHARAAARHVLDLAGETRTRAVERCQDGDRLHSSWACPSSSWSVGAGVVGSGKGSWFWPVFCTLLLTVGELYLSPIGLSLVTKVSPARIVSLMMGMWFLSSFLGNILSGYIGLLYEKEILSKAGFFWLLTGLGVATGFAIWAFAKPLKKAMASLRGDSTA